VSQGHPDTEERIVSRPHVVSWAEWLVARAELLAREKEATRARDALAARRRELPAVLVERQYAFQGPDGPVRLLDLFAGRRQLIVYHFMFGPGWTEGCPHCSHLADHFVHLEHLHARDTSLAVVARAPWETIAPFRERMGWTFPWYSTAGSRFSDDFRPDGGDGEWGALLVFLREGDRVLHTYTTTDRGVDHLHGSYNLLDLTPLGRQEDPRYPMSWVRHHDRYGDAS
jgi:predicted dithiol-disulfide oxidoreductase (DUF899 family)